MNESDPRHVKSILNSPGFKLPVPEDVKRKADIKSADVSSEIDGLTEDIQIVIDDMRLIGDPNLPKALDDLTEAAMLAQRDRRQ